MMKRHALLTALTGLGLGLAAIPSYAQGTNLIYNPTSIAASFQAVLTNFTSLNSVDIQATDVGAAPGLTYGAGQFAWDAPDSVFQIINNTQDAVPFAGQYPITPQLYFENLLLTENFSNGTTQSLPMFDIADPTTPTNMSDPFDLASDGLTPLTGDLQTNTVTLPTGAPTLVSAVLTGQFSDGSTPAGQPLGPVQVRIAAVPEPGTGALLLAGLLPLAALGLRARRSARRA